MLVSPRLRRRGHKLRLPDFLIAQSSALNGASAEATYIDKVIGYSPIAYWPSNEASGTDAICQVNASQNGTHTGVTLGQTGIGDGETCPFYDGANDVTDVYTATLNGVFDPAECTVMIWAKMDTWAWTDNTQRFWFAFRADGANAIQIDKPANGSIRWQYKAGGTTKTDTKSGVSEAGWFHLAITISATADEVKYFYGGSQHGSTDSSLGTWSGALSSTQTCVGAVTNSPTSPFDGYLAHCAVWNFALAPATIADLAVV